MGAVRLARLLRTRAKLYQKAGQDPKERVEIPGTDQAPKQEEPIRSPENGQDFLIIKNPIVLSDLIRENLQPLLYPKPDLFPRRGRPSVDLYEVLAGILHKFLADIPWYDLPANYPSWTTCNRYYLLWKRNRKLMPIILALLAIEIEIDYKELKSIDALFPLHPTLSSQARSRRP
jgi:transposase